MKKYLRIKIITVLALAALMFNACTEEYEDMNTKNSLVEEASVDLLLTYVQTYSVVRDAPNGAGTIGNYPGMTVSGANRPFLDGDAPGVWNNTFGNYVRNLSDIIHRTKDDPDMVNKNAIARIMKVWVFSQCTDTYGDIPYFDAALPLEEAVFQPKYDTQKDIYTDFFKELKEAAAQLDAGKASFGNADLIYGGDVGKWQKLANSLRLRLALRIRYADAAMAQENMSDLNESNLITTRGDDAIVYTATDYTENTNDHYISLTNSKENLTKRLATQTMVDMWKGNFDPRLKLFADTAMADWPGTEGYEDVDFFGYRAQPLLGLVPVEEKYPWGYESTSRWSSIMYVPVIEMPVIKSSEVYLALAEAALFGLKGSASEAQTFYAKGVETALGWAVDFYQSGASQLPEVLSLYRPGWNDAQVQEYIDFIKISQEEVDAFVDTASMMILEGSQEEKLEMIMNQKIAAFYPFQEYEGWFEWRRTGYPRVLVGSDDDALQGVSPRRMPYPTNEVSVNEANYDEAVKRIGGTDGRLVKVWWDANPDAPHKYPGTVPTMDHPWINE